MARRTAPESLHQRSPLASLKRDLFHSDELALLRETQPLVEELVGEYFHLTSFGPVRRCYEVVTLEGAGSEGKDPNRLAKVCRYDREERPIEEGHRVSRFYRVFLQDDKLLAREADGLELRALLLYVITHELIHIVRFESFQVHYGAKGLERQDEERIVHQLTREVLSVLKDEQVEQVIRGLEIGGVDVVESQR